jgi:hypothetical protein
MELKAFISYRRSDAFMHPEDGGADVDFSETIADGLRDAGFTVFRDVDDIIEGDHYEYRLREGLANADLFVAVIGERWLSLLNQGLERQKAVSGVEEDIVFREIRAALRQEKEVLPLLIDEAVMPRLGELPKDIRRLHYANAVSVRSTDSAKAISAKLGRTFSRMTRMRKLVARWNSAYLWFSILAYCFCAILTHVVGLWEYGPESWLGMVKAWGGFFIWPVVCLPFALVALYRPLTLVFEAVNRAQAKREAITYLTPLLLGLVLTLLAMVAEVFGEYETPWTIHPKLSDQCAHARGNASNRDEGLRIAQSQYDVNGKLAAEYEAQNVEPPFWLQNKCWPNVFFYLIEPAFRPVRDQSYFDDRPAIQARFAAILERKTTRAPYSYTFATYVASFFIQIWLAATGVVLSMFYAKVPFRRDDYSVLKLPSEDAYLCLTYAFVTLMVWIPFRLNTVYIKNLYFCADLNKCALSITKYQNDILLLLVLTIGYGYLTFQLLRQFDRRLIALFGAGATTVILACVASIIAYSDSVVRLADTWQFYFRCSILVVVLLIALWFQFNPEYIRRREFEEDIRQNESSK